MATEKKRLVEINEKDQETRNELYKTGPRKSKPKSSDAFWKR